MSTTIHQHPDTGRGRWTDSTAQCPTWCERDNDFEGQLTHVRKVGTLGVEISRRSTEAHAEISYPGELELSRGTWVSGGAATQLGYDLVDAGDLILKANAAARLGSGR